MPSIPSLVLSVVIATLYAVIFHLLWGRKLKELLIGWPAALLGFASGQVLATTLSWRDVRIGELHMLSASAAAWIFMALARRLKL